MALAVAAALVLVAAAYPLTRDNRAAAVATTRPAPAQVWVCTDTGLGDGSAGITCSGQVGTDRSVRIHLTPAQQAAVANQAQAVVASFEATLRFCAFMGGTSDGGGVASFGDQQCPPRPADTNLGPGQVRARLAGLGFPDAVVRRAGAGDVVLQSSMTIGAVLYGVRIGAGCLVGQASPPAQHWIEGPLLDGGCLPPPAG